MRSKAGGDRLRFIPFQLPTLVDEPPAGDGWLHEIKFDGYRTELIIERALQSFAAVEIARDEGAGAGVQ